MLKFSQFITEAAPKQDSNSLHAFDMDETLFAHDHNKLRVHVNDQHGRRVRSLTNQEFNSHQLPPGHDYDFSEFKSSDVFTHSAKPIRKMIAKLKAIKNNGGKTAIVTARSDLDDQPKFAKYMGKYGIDIGDTHVYRSGNIPGKPAETKAAVISGLIQKFGHKKVHLYDDSIDNLNGFLKLKKEHPDVEFHAHHVQHDPETGNVTVTSTSSEKPKDKKNA
jgi:hydroxymethylpyrimidine pyrophosphatase-like HAD family hydrolase